MDYPLDNTTSLSKKLMSPYTFIYTYLLYLDKLFLYKNLYFLVGPTEITPGNAAKLLVYTFNKIYGVNCMYKFYFCLFPDISADTNTSSSGLTNSLPAPPTEIPAYVDFSEFYENFEKAKKNGRLPATLRNF